MLDEDCLWLPFHAYNKTNPAAHSPGVSVSQQVCVEESIDAVLREKTNMENGGVLKRENIAQYVRKGLNHLDKAYQSLDASRPWILYWNLHSLELLGEPIPEETAIKVIKFLETCKDRVRGAYGGGPGQIAHLATTYGAVMALCVIGTDAAYNSIDRAAMYKFLSGVKQKDGSFLMHQGAIGACFEDGETDIRGVYCAAAIANILNIMTPALFDNTPQWLVSCQTYEGGFSGAKDAEAHGGYTFCGLAALVLVGHPQLCDLKSLVRWVSLRQMKFEGGFSGRANKLVDACYSFWVGACFAICRQLYADGSPNHDDEISLGNREAIQHYIIQCCQDNKGGLIDKPTKRADYYHTCYALSGLSIAQNHMAKGKPTVVGSSHNLLKPTHPLYNICMDKEARAKAHFKRMPPVE